MAKKEKELPINLFGKKYKESELSQEQISMIHHISDLNRKISSSEFNLTQLRFGKQAFENALKIDLEK